MSVGSILVGVAVTVIVGAYLAHPFRVVNMGKSADLDIEAWVSRVRAEGPVAGAAEADSEPVNFCSKCGRRLASGDRFCPGCGTQIERGAAQ